MTVSRGGIRVLVESLYTMAGHDSRRPPGPAALVAALIGADAIRFSDERVAGDAALVFLDERWRIYVRPGLRPERLAFVVAHELVEWGLRHHRRDDAIEETCNRAAAYVLMPDAALDEAIGQGLSPLAIAARFVAPVDSVRERLRDRRLMRKSADTHTSPRRSIVIPLRAI